MLISYILIQMKKKNFFRRQDKEYKKLKKNRIKKDSKEKKISPADLKARKRAQRALLFKKKASNDHKIQSEL